MNNAAELQKENESLRIRVKALEEQLRLLISKKFSPSSEKVSPGQYGLFNEAEEHTEADGEEVEEITVTVDAHKRKKKPRVSIPDTLPREEVIHDLPDEEKICPHDGHELKVIGSDDHEQLCEQHIVTAKKPNQPIEKSIASPGMLSYIATQKYCDALPLYRQSESFKRIGIDLDRTNMANWMVKMGFLVEPLVAQIKIHLQKQSVLHMDETTLQVLDEPGKPAQSKSYMWLTAVFNQRPAFLYHYSPSRSQQTPLSLLTESTQALMVDGYEGYQSSVETYQIERLGCWAHARRKFTDAQKAMPKGKTGKADQAIAFIQGLYRIEAKIKDDPPDKRYEIRQKQAKPIIDKMKKWLDKSLNHTLPSSKAGEALTYLGNQWKRLTVYLENGAYPIDNNATERAIRPFTIGRKNWMLHIIGKTGCLQKVRPVQRRVQTCTALLRRQKLTA